MKAFIVGSQGRLGRVIARVLSHTYEIVKSTHDVLDITDNSAVHSVVAAARPSVIVNCAAYNDVDRAENEPEMALAVNAFAVQSLAQVATDVNATLVQYSTDFVFDGDASVPYLETDDPNPRSVYAVSKLLGEWFAAETPRHYVLRVESLFGGVEADEIDGRRRRSSLGLLVDAMLEGKEVRAFVDRIVSPSYVKDVAQATVELLRLDASPGLYHCVGSGNATWFNVAIELSRRLNLQATIREITLDQLDLPARRPKFCALSNAKLIDAGVSMPTWQDAVERYLDDRRRGGSAALL